MVPTLLSNTVTSQENQTWSEWTESELVNETSTSAFEVVGGEEGVNLDAEKTLTYVYMAIGCVGLVGNLLVVVVLVSSPALRATLTNKLIINQSSIDLTASLSLALTSQLRDMSAITSTIAQEIICRAWLTNLPVWGLFLSSTYNMVGLTLERYLAIIYPLTHRRLLASRRTPRIALTVIPWCLGLGYNAAYMLPTAAIKQGACSVYSEWPDSLTQSAVGLLTVIIQFFFPLFLVTFFYSRIIYKLHRSRRLSREDTTHDNRTKLMRRARTNTLKTLALVFACFVLCWVWNQVYYLLYNLGYDAIDFNSTFYHFTVLAVFLNCCLNPVVYSLQYEQFQTAARQLLCCTGRGRRGAACEVVVSTVSGTMTTDDGGEDEKEQPTQRV